MSADGVDPRDKPRLVKFPETKPDLAHQTTPMRMLEDLLAKMRAGEIDPEALVIVAAFAGPQGDYTFEQWAAGPMTIADTLLYLEVAKHRILEQARA